MISAKGTVRIWRVYNNGHIKNETHVLWGHKGGTGYNGDVDKWSEFNKVARFGCAQIKKEKGEKPVILFNGYLETDRLNMMIERGSFK